MTSEQLDEIEKLARDPKSAAFHDLMACQTIPLVKALREAWEQREDYRNDAIAAEKECDRLLTSTALLTYLVEELDKVPRNGSRIKKLVERSHGHLLRLREYEGNDE